MTVDTEIGKAEILKMQRLALRDPDLWCESAFSIKLWKMQAAILRSVFQNIRTVVRSCSGSGKSFTAANAVMSFLYNQCPSTVITTAPTFRQVESILWREIAGLYARAPQLGGNLTKTQLDLTEKWFALGLSTDQPERFAGLHNENVLVIGDEGSGLPPEVYQAIENPMATGNAHELLIGNPTQPTGAFRDAFESPAYEKFVISAFDTPNFTELGITVEDIKSGEWEAKVIEGRLPAPYLITPRWVRERWEEWGEGSYQWDVYVLGEFPEAGFNNVFRLSDIERSMKRWKDNYSLPNKGDKVCSLDVSWTGEDESVFATRIGRRVIDFQVWAGQDSIYTEGRTVRHLKVEQPQLAIVDAVGIGAPVLDTLQREVPNVNVKRFNWSAVATDKERYGNRRAEMYFRLAKMLEDDEFDLPEDDRLKKDMTDCHFYYNKKGQVFIESKEEARARGIKSPDRLDSVIMTLDPLLVKRVGKPNVKYYG